VNLLVSLLLLPVAPVRGVFWVAEQIQDEVNRQYYGEGAIVKDLRQVDEARASGQLTDEEAAEREEELLQRRLSAPAGADSKAAPHG
jgi:Gas vesicle protein G